MLNIESSATIVNPRRNTNETNNTESSNVCTTSNTNDNTKLSSSNVSTRTNTNEIGNTETQNV